MKKLCTNHIVLGFSVFAFCLSVLFCTSLCAETIILKDGTKYEGKIMAGKTETVIMLENGEIKTVKNSNIKDIPQEQEDSKKMYEKMKKEISQDDAAAQEKLAKWCKENKLNDESRTHYRLSFTIKNKSLNAESTADDIMQLAIWAKENNLTDEAKALCKKVIADKDSDNEKAHNILGHIKIDTKWFTSVKQLTEDSWKTLAESAYKKSISKDEFDKNAHYNKIMESAYQVDLKSFSPKAKKDYAVYLKFEKDGEYDFKKKSFHLNLCFSGQYASEYKRLMPDGYCRVDVPVDENIAKNITNNISKVILRATFVLNDVRDISIQFRDKPPRYIIENFSIKLSKVDLLYDNKVVSSVNYETKKPKK